MGKQGSTRSSPWGARGRARPLKKGRSRTGRRRGSRRRSGGALRCGLGAGLLTATCTEGEEGGEVQQLPRERTTKNCGGRRRNCSPERLQRRNRGAPARRTAP